LRRVGLAAAKSLFLEGNRSVDGCASTPWTG
jgi:hypothetical protein